MPSLPLIFEYLDYRQYLRDAAAAMKEDDSSFTFRRIADATGIDSGYVAKIFQNERHISAKLVEPFIALFALPAADAAYFRELFLFCKARNHKEKDGHFKALISMNSTGRGVLSADQYELFAHWYNLAVRECLSFFSFTGDYAALGKCLSPRISPAQSRAAIRILEKLRLIEQDAAGVWIKINPVWTTGEDTRSLAVINYQKALLDMTKDAYDRVAPENRHMSTLTLSCSQAEYDDIVSDIQALRAKLLKAAADCPAPDRVIHCGFSVFPLSDIIPPEVAS